ncbi:MAG: PepSY domain-containing protein [Polyangiaceae bacterium]
MRRIIATLGITALALSTGCSGDSEQVQKLRDALGKAELSLADSVSVAELETSQGIGLRAALRVDADPVFAVGALSSDALKDVRVDIVSGQVLSMKTSAQSAQVCGESVSLNDAIAAAEAAVGGEAVSVEPDDDGQCNREVKVITSDSLWEVKVGPDGSIVGAPEEEDGADEEEEQD